MHNPMEHPHLNFMPTDCNFPASMTALNCHTNDVKMMTSQQTPPSEPQPMPKPMTNSYQQIANIATQQTSASVSIPQSGKPLCNYSVPSFSTLQNDIINMQNHPLPYLRAYQYMNFCNMHATHVVPPGSIWHYQICHHQQILQNHSTQWGSTENLQSHMTQLLHKGTLSTIQNISTVIPYQTQHTRSPTVTTALSTSLGLRTTHRSSPTHMMLAGLDLHGLCLPSFHA